MSMNKLNQQIKNNLRSNNPLTAGCQKGKLSQAEAHREGKWQHQNEL